MADKPATPREPAPELSEGDGGGDDEVVEPGEGAAPVPDGDVAVDGGVAVVPSPETLTASFWPALQCPGKVQVKKCSPAAARVILAGEVAVREMVELVLHGL